MRDEVYLPNGSGAVILDANNVATDLYYQTDHPRRAGVQGPRAGVVMLAYRDEDGDGVINTASPEEVLEESRYFPSSPNWGWGPGSGSEQEAYTRQSASVPFAFNGAEEVEGYGLHLTTFRTMAPETGLWGQSDPKAAWDYRLSPYTVNGGNPISYSDPHGDFIDPITLTVVVVTAAKIITAVEVVTIAATVLAVTATAIGVTGGFAGDAGGCPTCPIDYQAWVPEVQVVANPSGGYYDQSVPRYRYNGTFEQWTAEYALEGMSFQNAVSYWQQAHAADFAKYVKRMDGIGVANRLINFGRYYAMIGTVVAPAGGGGVTNGATYSSVAAKSFSPNFSSGHYLTPSRIMRDPSILKSVRGSSDAVSSRMSFNSSRWQMGSLGRGRSAGQGMTLRQLNSRGSDFTHKYIQYHPGSPRHFGGSPYWKVSGSGLSGNGTIRFPVY